MIRSAPYKENQDTRGRFLGITNTGPWYEINTLESRAGTVRGGHYHKETREGFYIIYGEIDVEVRNIISGDTTTFRACKDDIFFIEPMEVHVFNIRTDSKWINMLSKPMSEDESQIDIHTE